jgi:hypothetical protein
VLTSAELLAPTGRCVRKAAPVSNAPNRGQNPNILHSVSAKVDMPHILHYAACYVVTQGRLQDPVSVSDIVFLWPCLHLSTGHRKLAAARCYENAWNCYVVREHDVPRFHHGMLRTTFCIVWVTERLDSCWTAWIMNTSEVGATVLLHIVNSQAVERITILVASHIGVPCSWPAAFVGVYKKAIFDGKFVLIVNKII